MKYLYDVPFSTPAATEAYRSGWDAVFGKREPQCSDCEKPCEKCPKKVEDNPADG